MDKLGQAEVYKYLDSLNILYEYFEHPPIPTAEEIVHYKGGIESTTFCKNLFFRNHKGDKHYLVLLEYHKNLAIKDLEKILKQGKLSLTSGWRLEKYLGLQAGSVSPFGLINDTEHHVHTFVDLDLKNAQKISFHPNDNRASLIIGFHDFEVYMQSTGNSFEYLKVSKN
jgi:Ala-tRNA(Pro) deacylase